MFETGIRQFRMAMAMVNGRRIKPQLIQRLVADADATLREFGSPGDDVDQLLDGPFADPETRTHFQTQGLRRTARRLAERSPFYAARFAEAGPRPEDGRPRRRSRSVPVTTKADLVEHAAEFLCTDSPPVPEHPHHRHHRRRPPRSGCRATRPSCGRRWRRCRDCCATRSTTPTACRSTSAPGPPPRCSTTSRCAGSSARAAAPSAWSPSTRASTACSTTAAAARRRSSAPTPATSPGSSPRPAGAGSDLTTSRCDASTSPASCSPTPSPRRPTTRSASDPATRSR